MTARQRRDLAASVRQRLMNLAREQREDFQYLLTRYGLERLLYRLSRSPYADEFILKGAVLFQLWAGQPHRATRDLDLLGSGSPSLERIERVFHAICSLPVEDDGLTFVDRSLRAEQIREEQTYQGVRVRAEARLGSAKIPLRIDVGFGDAVTPGPITVAFPTLLEFPGPSLLAYPQETVVAEKFQAIIVLGMANSRMKDFYDLWTLAREYEFEGPMLSSAIRATFDRRQTAMPLATPLALSAEFSGDRAKATQWQAFVRKGRLVAEGLTLGEVTAVLDGFLMPPVAALIAGKPFPMRWPKAGPWQ